MNYASLNSNGESLVAVGDSTDVFVLTLQEFDSRRAVTFQGRKQNQSFLLNHSKHMLKL
jgi:hypothetical protein